MRHPARDAILILLVTLCAGLGLPAVLGDDEPAGEPGDPGDTPTTTAPPAIEKALSGLMVPASLDGDFAVVSYAFDPSSDREPLDWIWLRKPDKAKLETGADIGTSSSGWDVGAGSDGVGKVVHKVEFAAPCSISLDFYCWYNGPSSNLVVTLCEAKAGQGLGIEWGRQLVRKSGKRVPLPRGERPAREQLKAGRDYTMRIEVTKEGEVVSTWNGVEVLRAPLEEKDRAPGKIGFEIHDARILLRSIAVDGKVDAAWAEKEAKKVGKGKKGGK